MPQPTDQDDPINQATDLARDIAPDLDVVLITHYPDAETLDTFRPGDTDLRTTLAVNRAVAREMLDAGVEILVQRADRAAFRRWLADRDDTPEHRRAWIDRTRLLRGSAALEVLGLKGSNTPRPETFGKAPGPIADRLLDAFVEEDSGEFDGLVQDLLAAGRTDVLDLAGRKLREREGDEAGDELNWVLLVAAEGAPIGPSGWAELVALAVALPAGDLPDGEALGQSLIASGALADSEELRLLPGWRSPDALDELSFGAVRRVLLDLVDGKPPRDLPPGDTDELARRGFGVLLGLRIDWAIPIWEEIAAAGGLPDDADEDAAETPEEKRRAAQFDRWRGRVFKESQGCVPLAVVAFSQVANEIADFLAEAGEQMGGLDEIRDFVAACRREAGGDEVVCHLQIEPDALELSVYTEGGRWLDSLTVPAGRLPLPAEEMPALISPFVRLVQDRPGG
nr:hypothetical protein [uncultured Rhodopila sp.]